ncbi:hypothetical protein [Fusibacter tunisiensis]|uniref:Methionine-R-sulfoxide reductase with GAF domain n=1 Tax=Fusibacter tunisiensis TaxID=1008308 RepID=A0ABS2MSU2_9FIRM|nr:hypothetical protein [Fusibacter tunisiensis]MBM7562493.1 putative methionine-R-sulfoxide reductase with GAF domain [Fusibacter tunisiensis]
MSRLHVESRNHLIGVLDIDSPELERFTAVDQKALEEIAQIMLQYIHFPINK